MRRLLALCVIAAGLPMGCVPKRTTAASRVPSTISGFYYLTLEPSPICRLPITKARFTVIATNSGTAVGDTIKITMPNGNPAIELSLLYESSTTEDLVGGALAITGDRVTQLGVAFDDDRRLYAVGTVHGVVSGEQGERGEIRGGFDGPIAVSRTRDRRSDTLGSCSAANHTFSLTLT
jgi:hypothetical protein